MQDKQRMRSEVVRRRRSLDATERDEASARATDRLVALDGVQASDVVVLYSPMDDEADPSGAVTPLIAAGKQIAFPRVNGDDLDLVVVRGVSDLQPGYRGILEPGGPGTGVDEIDVVVVPGVAFDRSGGRLGQGGGHYDRLLARLAPATLRVGFCFSAQLVDRVPQEEHDEPVDVLVTDEEVFRTGARPYPE